MDRKRQKMTPEKNDVQEECQDAKIAALERRLAFVEFELQIVTAELKQVKEENSQLKSKVKNNREQWTELLYDNVRLQRYLQELESANINLEEKSQINLYESDLVNQIKIEESNDGAVSINALPDEMILKIFGYLEQNHLGQIARTKMLLPTLFSRPPLQTRKSAPLLDTALNRVCSRWNNLIKSPALWKKVDVKFHCSHKSLNTMTRCFVNMLPSCVSSIRLDYSNLDTTEELNFEEFNVRLQRRCPHFEMLILEHVHFSDNLPLVIGLCTHFLPDVKILVFRHSTFSDCPTRQKFGGISKIEILDVSDCEVGSYQEIQFSDLPQLRVLTLRNSWIISTAFLSLQQHALNLEELYLCDAFVFESDLVFTNSMFPHLKIICIHCRIHIFNSVISAIKSCQSLQKVYVHECFMELNVMSHPFFKDNRSKLTILETVAEHHNHNVDYSCKRNKN